MNDKQPAALTDREREDIAALRRVLGLSRVELVIALADARLEVARLTEKRNKFICKLCGQDLIHRHITLCERKKRDMNELTTTQTLEVIIGEASSYSETDCHGDSFQRIVRLAKRAKEEIDQQREDIRRPSRAARLIEKRREKDITISELRERGNEYQIERDQQRGDIRRLLSTIDPNNPDGRNWAYDEQAALFDELSAKYPEVK